MQVYTKTSMANYFLRGQKVMYFTVCILEPSSSELVPNSYIELTLIDCSEHVWKDKSIMVLDDIGSVF